MGRTVTVARAEHFGPGKRKLVFAGDRRIAVFSDGGTVHAVDDRCTHHGGPLSEGSCEDGVVTCPWHGGRFRLVDGKGLGPPAYRTATVYPVRVTNGMVEVHLPDDLL